MNANKHTNQLMHPGGPLDNYLFAKWVSMSVVGLPNPDLLKM